MLDICHPLRYNSEAVSENAAIAQSVERILGKDEVASSNLASSSKKERPLIRVVFFCTVPNLNNVNALGECLRSGFLNFSVAPAIIPTNLEKAVLWDGTACFQI